MINNIVDLWVKKQQESEKRRQLIEKLNRSFSTEKILLDKSVELAKAHMSKESLKSMKLITDAKTVLRKEFSNTLGAQSKVLRLSNKPPLGPLSQHSSFIDTNKSIRSIRK